MGGRYGGGGYGGYGGGGVRGYGREGVRRGGRLRADYQIASPFNHNAMEASN